MTVTKEALWAVMTQAAPQASDHGLSIEEVHEEGIIMRLDAAQRHLRPGGTVSGPTLMYLVDCAAWLSLLAQAGAEINWVTTNLDIQFLRRAPAGAVRARGRRLRVGRSLGVVQVEVTADGVEGAVATATVSYALPRPRSAES